MHINISVDDVFEYSMHTIYASQRLSDCIICKCATAAPAARQLLEERFWTQRNWNWARAYSSAFDLWYVKYVSACECVTFGGLFQAGILMLFANSWLSTIKRIELSLHCTTVAGTVYNMWACTDPMLVCEWWMNGMLCTSLCIFARDQDNNEWCQQLGLFTKYIDKYRILPNNLPQKDVWNISANLPAHNDIYEVCVCIVGYIELNYSLRHYTNEQNY